jgi:hypothetical protein
MSLALLAALGVDGRHLPEPGGTAGLVLGGMLIGLLLLQQMRSPWYEHTAPGPVPSGEPAVSRDARQLAWGVHVVLGVLLLVVIIERFLVLS